MPHKFDPEKLEKLNNPERLTEVPPGYIWTRLNLRDCRVLIDLGAGTGLYTREFLPMMPGGTIHAADTSTVMLDFITEHVAADHPSIVPVQVQESVLPFDNDMADAVLMINLYHELDDRPASLAEIHRVLRSGGTVCVVDFKKIKTDHGPPVEHRIDAGAISTELSEAGFEGVKTDLGLETHSIVWATKP